MKRLSSRQVVATKCPKCGGVLRYLAPFEGRTRFYCDECKEEILNQPWSPYTAYPQDTSLPSPSTFEGSH